MLVNWQEHPIPLADHPQAAAAALRSPLLPAPTTALPHWMKWNQEAAFPVDQCVHHLFEQQVLRTPAASAVCFVNQPALPSTHPQGMAAECVTLTYHELNQQANQLAHYLQTQGVGPETLVGICVERSPALIVGLLAILKAGGAYMPLDPYYPTKRLAYMVADAAPPIILTQSTLLATLPAHTATVISLDRDWPLIAQQPTYNPVTTVTPDNLAYVIYTSGSTGHPKGVLVEHRGLCNVTEAQVQTFGLTQADRVLQFSSLNFDAATFELWLALRVGAALYLASRETLAPGEPLLHFLAQHAITMITVTPSTLAALPVAALPALHTITVAGEACPASLVASWAGGRRFFNLYGPTEATIWSTAMHCTISDQPPPIGQPIANTQIYLLNEQNQPVALGEAGEMAIGGVGVARGYLNQPAMTAAKFIANPFGPGKLYKSGDLAHWQADGHLVFLGRVDQQVKIRGFRVELGEIEHTLLQHHQVRESAVALRAMPYGQPQLVAYVVLKETDEGGRIGADLRAYLQTQLPDYMIPAAFVLLPALPLSPNGKLDRAALPTPDSSALVTTPFVAPQTSTEALIADLWREVLGIDRVGRHDNFFALGGHSLLATQLVARLRTALAREVAVSTLFAAPTVAEVAAALAAAPPSQGAPLQPLDLTDASTAATATHPLSYAQQRLWFLDQWATAPDTTATTYTIVQPLRLSGPLQVTALHAALHAIVQRHAILRTTFPAVDGVPQQVIAATLSLPLPIVDLQQCEDQAAALQQQLQEAAGQPFSLATGPLLRTTLYRLTATEHVLLLTCHHIIIDGWSLGVFAQELDHGYRALSRGQGLSLPPLPCQYVDFVHWQQQWLHGAELARQRAYWQQQLANAPSLLALPTDYPRPAHQQFKGGAVTFTVDMELTIALQTFSQQQGVTLFMTLYAAFAVLLARYSGQDDLVIGTTIANRRLREVEPLIGFFVNTLALRANLRDNPPFTLFLQQARQLLLDAYTHQDLPFEQIVSDVVKERSLSYAPLCQVMLTFDNTDSLLPTLGDLALAPVEVTTTVAKFDLLLSLTARGGRLQATLEYDRALFAHATIERMAGHWQTILHAIVATPEVPIQKLPLLTAAERHQLLVTWNATARAYPQAQTVAQIFEEQAARTPDAIAVIMADLTCAAAPTSQGRAQGESLTYAELNERANQLAYYLQKQGVGPEVLVGLCLERSPAMIVGLLAILKAGGAYVPLDPTYPQARLQLMIEEAAPPLLLTQQTLEASLPAQTPSFCLDRDWHLAAAEPTTNLPPCTTADNLAYVMYTSGSTGRPKGVCIEQRGIVRLVCNPALMTFTAADVFLQVASIAFDAATLEIWGALLNGGRLVLMTPGTPSLSAIGAVLRHYGVTTLLLTSGPFHALVDECISDLHGVRQLMAGGDVLSVAHVERVLQKVPSCQVINVYGPTENTTFTCCYPFPAGVSVGPSALIGRPIANTQVYILDAQMQPTPIGVPGELYTSGDGLARGYLHQPALTAERFLDFGGSPLGASLGLEVEATASTYTASAKSKKQKLYKTGDLARWLPNGNIEFLGRLDQQVKIRGFRIELGEIETTLLQHPLAQAAVVVVRADQPGQKRLVAYVVPKQDEETEGDSTTSILHPSSLIPALREHLQNHLPAYMVPTAIVLLAALPLTPNGKIDRQALPAPEAPADLAPTAALPQTPTEAVLAAIWGELLGIETLGRQANFFDLGGHSLLATQVIARIRTAFAVELAVRTLFEAPTIAELAAILEQHRMPGEKLLLPEIVAQPQAPLLPLASPQQRLWFLDQLEGSNATYNIPLACRLTGPLDTVALHAALTALVERHSVLRTTFPTSDGKPRQQIAPHLTLPLTLVAVPATPEQSTVVQGLLQEAVRQPFDLATGPLLRATLYQLASDEHLLLLLVHHIVADGWSVEIVWREVAAFYRAYVVGAAADLAVLPVQYADFALWQQTWLQRTDVAAQRAYWRTHLANAPATLALPTDYPRPPMQTFAGAMVELTLPANLTADLQRLSRQQAVTLFMTLYATFAVLLSRYSDQSDLVIGTTVANRRRQETEGLIGFFANTLPLRVDLRDNPRFTDLLQRVRHLTLDAYAHQDIPFEDMISDLGLVRNLSHTPLFQVMLTMDNTPAPEPCWPDLTVTPVELTSTVAKFDLTLQVRERAGALQARFEYNTDLFAPATIERMAGHWQTLLQAIVTDPATPIARLPLLTTAEAHQLLIEWNQTAAPYPHEQTMQQIFEAQAARTGDALAVVMAASTPAREGMAWGECLTYAELNARANALAHYLQTVGVGPDVLVGICVERSPAMIVGVLAILKAGGAYVPLDPTYPSERLAFMLADAQVALLLTQAHLLPHLPTTTAPILCLDRDQDRFIDQCQENPSSGLQPHHLAYVIYTSGSTGQPKGVLLTHQNLVHSTTARFRRYPTPVERFLLLSSLAFDSSVAGIFWTLSQGGALVLPPPLAEKEVDTLVALIHRHAVTHLLALPSLYTLLLTYCGPVQLASLQVAIVAGEACPVTLPAYHQARLPHATLYNEYGPTEGAVWSSVYPLPPDWQGATVPIGGSLANALPNVQLYLLDRALQPVPLGVPGELYIGGAGLARGYLNRPDLTTERFVDCSFESFAFGVEPVLSASTLQAKLLTPHVYKTGDLARRLPDGNFEFLGRLDQQVKLRGFRIELGEIESVLAQHPQVSEAVVVLTSDASGDNRLVAYVVASEQSATHDVSTESPSPLVTPFGLRGYLQAKLPAYMVPVAIVLLERLPLTPNGKVDRKALPSVEQRPDRQDGAFIAPRTAFEESLATIWRALLNIPAVSIDDNFFELGGHSLLLAQLAAHINATFQIQLSLRTLFQGPTLEAMSLAILEALLNQADSTLLSTLLAQDEDLLRYD